MGGETPTKKMVKRVKEIVHDFSDEDIRAMLEQCDMDPNEAVQRLLVQDTFHEVKSKRERRKEVKEMQELKLQGGSYISNWAADGDDDGLNFSNAYKNETGSAASYLSRPSYAYPHTAKAISQKSGHMSASFGGENREPSSAGNIIESKPPGFSTGGKTSTVETVKVSPRWAEARSYLQDVMRRSEGYDSGHSKTDSGSGGASGCSQDSSEQISPHSQTGCHQTSQDSDAGVRRMSSSSESHHTSSETSDKDDGGVLLPSHVQALAAEGLNLTFGTYKTHSSSALSGQHKSDPSIEADSSLMQQLYLPEHLLKDILGPALPSDEVPSHSGDMQRYLGSSTESSLQYFSQRDVYNSTYPPDESRYNTAISDMKSQAISLPEKIYGADYDDAAKLPRQAISIPEQRNLGRSTESSLQYFRQRDMYNSTHPPDESRYNTAVFDMKSQAISIPEKIYGADYDKAVKLSRQAISIPEKIREDDHHKAVKLPHQLFDTQTQNNHTLDGVGNLGGYPNTLQNFEHKPSAEDLLQYLAAGHGLPSSNKRQEYPLTSLARSSVDASSGFGSSVYGNGSFLPNASVAPNSPGFLPISPVNSNAPPGFLPNAPVASNAPPGFLPNASVPSNAPPGFQTFHDRNPFPGQIGSNTVLDYGVRSRSMPNVQEQRAYGSLLDYGVRSGAMISDVQGQRGYGSSVEAQQRYQAMLNAQEQLAFSVEAQQRYRPMLLNAQEQPAYGSSVEAQQGYRYMSSDSNLSLRPNNNWQRNY